MQTLAQDLRFALRQLRKSPGFTVLAALTLAIGIGSATAVFSLVDAVLLRPLPFVHPDRLVALDTLHRAAGNTGPATLPASTSYPNFFDWRDQATSLAEMASSHDKYFNLAGGSGPARRLDALVVSSGYFHVFGVSPAIGRNFLRTEEQAGNRSVILSHSLWASLFNGNRDVLGKTIRLDDVAYSIVGVAPADFSSPNAENTDLWVTPGQDMEGVHPSGKQRSWDQLDVVARLAPGATVEQAYAEMQRIQRGLAAQYPDDDKNQDAVSVTPELDAVVGDVQRPLRILFASVCFLLLIACANVAGLLLTRAASRQPELAVRAALGASRLQIIRQLLLESLLLSLIGGLAGFALAVTALRIAPWVLPPNLPRVHELAVDSHIFLFAIAASLLTGLLFGVLPAWRMSKLDPALALRDNSRAMIGGRGQQRLRAALVIGETALGLVMVIGAGLLIHSFNQILHIDPGFDPKHLLTFRVGTPESTYTDAQQVQLAQDLQRRLSALPGVEQATYGFPLPMTGNDIHVSFEIDGRAIAPADQPSAQISLIASNFFSTMKIPLLHGRLFTAADDQPKAAPTIIVNQALVDRYFPGEDAVGKRIRPGISDGTKPMREIIGVVSNVSRLGLTDAPKPEYYIPFSQATIPGPFAIRVAGDPAQYADTVRKIVAEENSGLPVYKIATYDSLLARSRAQQRFQTMLLTAFATIALLLAAVGLYGVLSYMVTQRTQELGLRMALGAQRSDVLSLILKQGLLLASIGLAVGLGTSALLTRYLSSLLFHTEPLDIATFASTTGLLLAVSTVACIAPALRASRLDPNETLRTQ